MKIPLSLSIYEHAAALISKTPGEVSHDGDLMVQAHERAYNLYRHFPVMVGIDIYNIESEAYGCTIQEPGGTGIPAIIQPLFSSLDDAMQIEPFDPAQDGRIPVVLQAGRDLIDKCPDADVRIPVAGPFPIAQNLLGLNQLMLEVATNESAVRDFLFKLIEGQVLFSRVVIDAGLKVAFFESAAAPPLLSPAHFRAIELPPLKSAIQAVGKVAGHSVPCIIGGDTSPVIPEMLETGTQFLICPSETDRTIFLKKMEPHPEVTIRVNMDPGLYTYGTRKEIYAEVDEIVKLAGGRKNILLGTGAIPYETPPENLLSLKQYVS